MRSTAFLRSVTAAFTLVAVVVGPPAALWQFRSAYLPGHVPNPGEFVEMLTSPDDGGVFLVLLVGAGLVAWLQLLVAITVEVVAWLSGATVPRLPGFGWAQRIAAGVLLLLLSGTAAAEAAEPAPATLVASVLSAGNPPSTDASGRPVHVVAPGESLTRIAETELGNKNRYQELFDLNHGVRQPSGGALRDANLLKPGWILALPQDESTDCEEVVVRPGQTLSQIARDRLGDPRRYREIFDRSRGRAQPSGRPLTDPDRLQPGDVLLVPVKVPPPSGGGGASAAAPASCAPSPPAPPEQPPPVAPRPISPTTPRPQQQQVAGPVDTSLPVGAVAGIGAVLAAGLLALLAARRRRTGRPARPFPREREFESTLRETAEPVSVESLDRALRTLAHNAHDRGVGFPPLISIRLGAKAVRLRLAEPTADVAPFRLSSAAEWRLDPDAVLDDQGMATPYPTLVSLGHSATGELVLINLAQIGVIALRGAADDIEAVLLAMAWDLVAAPWAEQTTITLIGVGQSTATLNPARARFAQTWADALEEDFSDGRTHLLLAAQSLDSDQLRRLNELEHAGIAAVVTALADDVDLPGSWLLDVTAERTFVEPLQDDIALQRLTPGQVHQLVTALGDVREQVGDPEPAPTPGNPEPPVRNRSGVPAIRLLGPVSVQGVDPAQVEAKKLNRLTELAAYLTLHPGVTADEISHRLGTNIHPWSAATRQGYISRLRTWLGTDADGELYLPNVDARYGGYRMSNSFGCDWHQFQTLANNGLRNLPGGPLDDLQAALDLVAGMPFGNVPPGRYAWNSWIQREMIDAVVDVAHTLADAHQKAGDLPAARRAVLRGLLAEPISEVLYRDLLRIEYRAGNVAAVRESADKLADLAAALDIELDDETTRLVSGLLHDR
ncbi:BTAD domain-containing putative transcriptional regulator [Amycolatopsis mediterranei]|uniref:BTAD domain-containing putative transcriptional regulator n=1 Tax=Amycolatopsis mediterranei TaxID=33910 RepID=UPI00085261A6|nr:BTAD domain-containing putative transcriptional regulator [Amycolatopsis mediterranei]